MAVTFEGGSAVGTITIDKPPANSYDFDFMEEMGAAVDAAAADDAVKVVIVRSASKRFFCAGADIKAFLANDTAGNMKMISRGHEALAAIARVPKVFIALVEGHALGGGLEITLACDLRFGARGGYKLGVPEVTLGLLPGNGGTQRLSRMIGVPRALDLMVTGRQISPGEAHNLGILNRLFAAGEAAQKTQEYAEQLAAGATAAIGEIKVTTYEGMEMGIDDALARERAGIERLFGTEDAREGLSAFAEKRKAEFKVSERSVDFLIVGGGDAGFSAARSLREEGAEGSVLIVSRDPDPPYDRTAVSKGYLGGEKDRKETLLGDAAWYSEHDVELLTRTSATKLDPDARTVTLANQDVITYGKLLLATGANVRRLRIDGSELDGIHYLRALGNADSIRSDTENTENVVLVGGSYIATEVAATLTALGRRCTIVMQEETTLERTFGKTAGGYFQKVLVDHGVQIHGGEDVERFEGDGRVQAVATKAGHRYPADAVVVGVGVMPDITLAKAAGLKIGERGGVLTDATLATSAPDVWAAGDIAEYQSSIHGGRHVRIEHWDVAEQQGKTAALNMLGRDAPHETIPYFFSDLSDWTWMEYVGPAYEWTEEIVRGSVDDGQFTIYYLDGDRLAAALSVDRSDDLEQARELIAGRAPVDREQLARVPD